MSVERDRHHMKKDYFLVYNEIMRNEDLTSSDKIVYVAICNLANNKTGICYAKQSTIAKNASVTVPTVRKAVKNLEEAGFISVEKKQLDGMRLSYIYFILDVSTNNEESEVKNFNIDSNNSEKEVLCTGKKSSYVQVHL